MAGLRLSYQLHLPPPSSHSSRYPLPTWKRQPVWTLWQTWPGNYWKTSLTTCSLRSELLTEQTVCHPSLPFPLSYSRNRQFAITAFLFLWATHGTDSLPSQPFFSFTISSQITRSLVLMYSHFQINPEQQLVKIPYVHCFLLLISMFLSYVY